MFILKAKPTFKADVFIPSPDGGGTIKFEFVHKGRKALAEFIKTLTGEGVAEAAPRSDADALGEVIAGWSGVDEKYSPAALETLLDEYPTAAKAIFDRYVPALMDGLEKNSGK